MKVPTPKTTIKRVTTTTACPACLKLKLKRARRGCKVCGGAGAVLTTSRIDGDKTAVEERQMSLSNIRTITLANIERRRAREARS